MTDQLFDLAPNWPDSDKWQARPINRRTAEQWCQRWHYLASAGVAMWPYGIYPTRYADMVSLVIFAETAIDGVAKSLGLTHMQGNREISRVVAHPDAPPNTASKAVATACKQHHTDSGDLWVYSYADASQGHHGGIYQALNAVYVGCRTTHAYLVGGVRMHGRQVTQTFGHERVPDLRSAGVDIVRTPSSADKLLYVLPIGTPAQRRQVRAALTHKQLPYPKRT